MSNANFDTTLEQAQAVEEAGDLAGALALSSEAVGEQPETPDTHYFKGPCLFQLNRYDEAIVDLSRALELQPEFLSAYSFRALARYATGDHTGAIADNTTALTFPEFDSDLEARLLYARAMSRRAVGEGELAEQDVEAARLRDPGGELDPRRYGH
jgi:tetratricopeptide (TPR) repeat protein